MDSQPTERAGYLKAGNGGWRVDCCEPRERSQAPEVALERGELRGMALVPFAGLAAWLLGRPVGRRRAPPRGASHSVTCPASPRRGGCVPPILEPPTRRRSGVGYRGSFDPPRTFGFTSAARRQFHAPSYRGTDGSREDHAIRGPPPQTDPRPDFARRFDAVLGDPADTGRPQVARPPQRWMRVVGSDRPQPRARAPRLLRTRNEPLTCAFRVENNSSDGPRSLGWRPPTGTSGKAHGQRRGSRASR